MKTLTVCPRSPYSWDLALCDFWLSPKVKMTGKDKLSNQLRTWRHQDAVTKDPYKRGLAEMLQKVARIMR